MKKKINFIPYIFGLIFILVLSGCSDNAKPQTPKEQYFTTLQHLEKKCDEGLGTARWCTVWAEKLENPPSDIYPDDMQAALAYNYASYAAKRDCGKQYIGGCKYLDYLTKKGKGGLGVEKEEPKKKTKRDIATIDKEAIEAYKKNPHKQKSSGLISMKPSVSNAIYNRARKRVERTITIGN